MLETLHTPKKKNQKNPIFTNLKKRFEHIELPAKLLDYFLRSNKSNVNQTWGARIPTLHLNHVAVYINSLLFLCEQTYNYSQGVTMEAEAVKQLVA